MSALRNVPMTECIPGGDRTRGTRGFDGCFAPHRSRSDERHRFSEADVVGADAEAGVGAKGCLSVPWRAHLETGHETSQQASPPRVGRTNAGGLIAIAITRGRPRRAAERRAGRRRCSLRSRRLLLPARRSAPAAHPA